MQTQNSVDGQKERNVEEEPTNKNPVLKEPMHHQQAHMPLPGSNWSDDDAHNLIVELRSLIFMYGPRNMVLDDAEALAQHCWTSIRDGQPWK